MKPKQLIKKTEVKIKIKEPEAPVKMRSEYFNKEYEKEKKLFFK